ncbi:hypothetical protein [Myceligenerans crystallogenes]
MTLKSTAKKHVNRVVATIALATAAGAATAPAFAADPDSERGADGYGRDLGADGHRALFGGTGHGVQVNDDGTVTVRADVADGSGDHGDGVPAGGGDQVSDAALGGLVSEIVEGAAAAAEAGVVGDDATDDAGAPADDVLSGVVEETVEVVDETAGAVGETAEQVTEAAAEVAEPAAEVLPETESAGSRPQEAQQGAGNSGNSGKQAGPDAGQGKGEKNEGSQQESGGDSDEDVPRLERGLEKDAEYWAPLDIDYGLSGDSEDLPPAVPADEDAASGDLLAFEATAKALGYDVDGERTDYQPRHKAADLGDEPQALDVGQVVADAGRVLSDALADIEVTVSTDDGRIEADAEVGGATVHVGAGQDGLAAEAGVPGVADATVDANDRGVGVSAGVAETAGADVRAGVPAGDVAERTGDAAQLPTAAPAGEETVAGGGARENMLLADRGAEYDTGAEYLSHTPSALDEVGEAADAATEQATIDAPLRMATTGSEAAALTGAAGALVVGGAAALVMANRTGRREAAFALSKTRPAL